MIETIRQWSASLRGQPGDPPWLGSVGISAAVHIGLVFVLAALLTNSEGGAGDSNLDGNWAELETVVLDLTEIEKPSTSSADAKSNGGQSTGRTIAIHRPLTTQAVPEPRDLSPAPVVTLNDPELVRSFGESVKPLSSGSGSGDGSGDGNGGKGKTGLGFFGGTEAGKSYVYVLDSSRSMNHPHDGHWKSRMQRLKAELVRSVRTLNEGNRFFIVYFNTDPNPMPARKLVPAVPRTQKRYLKWAVEQRPEGDTRPSRALRLALRLKPDVIYFLTDGQFETKVHRILRKVRQNRVVIHTYALGNPDSEKILRELAVANGGKYHFIP